MQIKTSYQGNMRFSHGAEGAQAVMDAGTEVGGLGEALSPKQMVLQGLAGCTGLDVVTMLNRRKVRFENFSIEIEAEQTTNHPRVFKEILITYKMKAAQEDRQVIERMITLSEKQFCGVSAMLGKTAKISWELICL
jgi:putative redox protein